MKNILKKIFERVTCPNCDGVGWWIGGNYSWKCEDCGSDHKVFKYGTILKILVVIFIIIFVCAVSKFLQVACI